MAQSELLEVYLREERKTKMKQQTKHHNKKEVMKIETK